MTREIYRRVYDDPIDKDGKEKPNELLGTFTVEKQLFEDFYAEEFIGIRQEDGKRYLVIGKEVSYYNGGIAYSIRDISDLQPTSQGE